MWEVAKRLRYKRKNKTNFNDTNRKVQDNFNNKHTASILIEEFMVAANIEVAKYLIKNQVS
jgi:exoribonuclease R